MKENITLTFPSGEFTHSMLAQANGKTNQQVWQSYQKAIKDGVIIFVGNKSSGKGKPSKYWKMADGQPVPLVDKVVVIPAPMIVAEPVVDVILPVVAPTVPPVVNVELAKPADAPFEMEMGTPKVTVMLTIVEEPVVEETIEVIQVDTAAAPVVHNILPPTVTEIEEKCPFCQTKLLSVKVDGSVRVWCPVNDLTICASAENPYGAGNTVKNAVEVLNDKFFKHKA